MDEPRPIVDDGRPDDTSVLWRGVPLKPTHIVLDQNSGTYRISSAAFDDPEMSVAVADEAKSVDYLTKRSDEYGVVAFSAGFAREHGQKVVHDPWPAEPAHALVLGTKTRTVCRAFARHVRWQHRPQGYDERSLPDPAQPSTERGP